MDSNPAPGRSRWRGKAAGIGLAAAGAVAGGVLAGTLTASAADTSTATPTPSYGCPRGQNPNETVLTGADAAIARAAALKAVPGGTVLRLETDAGDGTYEAHMTKADGTLVTVKFDKNFKVIAIEGGMGKGDPAPGRHPSGSRQSPSPSST